MDDRAYIELCDRLEAAGDRVARLKYQRDRDWNADIAKAEAEYNAIRAEIRAEQASWAVKDE